MNAILLKKIPTIIRHIPFHLMKPIKPKEVVRCLCKDCIIKFARQLPTKI